jgi:hypothetical protein
MLTITIETVRAGYYFEASRNGEIVATGREANLIELNSALSEVVFDWDMEDIEDVSQYPLPGHDALMSALDNLKLKGV